MRARKRFGQHFLEPAWVDKLVRAIDPRPDQSFIEIGPGRGALTRPLAARANRVIAYEIDRDLAAELRNAALANVDVIEGDFLEQFPGDLQSLITNPPNPSNPPDLPSSPNPQSPIPNPCRLRVAGNLPYNVASPIMFALVDAYVEGAPIIDATLMLQLEVAQRLVARPATKEYGVLTILIGHCADVDLLLKLPPGAFRPAPKVRSAVVRLRFHAPAPPVRDRRAFEALVRAVFTRRRKTLANALQARGRIRYPIPVRIPDRIPVRIPDPIPDRTPGLSIDLSRRPETLTIAEFAALSDVFSSP